MEIEVYTRSPHCWEFIQQTDNRRRRHPSWIPLPDHTHDVGTSSQLLSTLTTLENHGGYAELIILKILSKVQKLATIDEERDAASVMRSVHLCLCYDVLEGRI